MYRYIQDPSIRVLSPADLQVTSSDSTLGCNLSQVDDNMGIEEFSLALQSRIQRELPQNDFNIRTLNEWRIGNCSLN